MKIIYNKVIPFGKRFYAINLFGILFAKGHCNRETLNHERIHTAQIRELLYVFFYVFYVLEWLIRFIGCMNYYRAYENISFEREAYSNDRNLDYLKTRRHFAFLKYI